MFLKLLCLLNLMQISLSDLPKDAIVNKLKPLNPYDIKGDDIDKGGEVSKACRYDDAEWSDCDPFEMIRYRTLRLISGGRQCEEMKNITKHCTADESPPGNTVTLLSHFSNNFLIRYQMVDC